MMDWILFFAGMIIGAAFGVGVIGIMFYSTVTELRIENAKLDIDVRHLRTGGGEDE